MGETKKYSDKYSYKVDDDKLLTIFEMIDSNRFIITKIELQESINFYQKLEKNHIDSDFKDFLREWYQKYITSSIQANIDGVEKTEEDEDIDSDELIEPYDPNEVRYSLKLFSVSSLVDYITGFDGEEAPTIIMDPDFQRNFVWSNKDKSLLIESILLNIPIPSIYLNEAKMGEYFPADGLQRLNTLMEFMTGKLKLTGLEYLTEYNGYQYKIFNENENNKKVKILPINVKRQIRDYQITCFVIELSTPENVKLDIFKRLNSTGVKLSSQELRNAITSQKVRDLYKTIERNEIFKLLITDTVNTNRFVHHEFILRFFGFYYSDVLNEVNYKGAIKNLLDKVLILMNNEDEKKLTEISNQMLKSIRKAYLLFGEHSFRKSPSTNAKSLKSPINTVLYTQFLIQLLDFNVPDNKPVGYASNIFFKYLQTNSDFVMSISSATNNLKNIESAKNHINRFLNYDLFE